MKSYGRAPTFLLRTGYEQVRSVVAALAGDWEAARRVDFVLPETGVCNGGAAPAPRGRRAPVAAAARAMRRSAPGASEREPADIGSASRPAWRSRAWGIVGALSITEIVSWGVLYYAFAAFLVPMQRGARLLGRRS